MARCETKSALIRQECEIIAAVARYSDGLEVHRRVGFVDDDRALALFVAKPILLCERKRRGKRRFALENMSGFVEKREAKNNSKKEISICFIQSSVGSGSLF